jgi:hypothetical protein
MYICLRLISSDSIIPVISVHFRLHNRVLLFCATAYVNVEAEQVVLAFKGIDCSSKDFLVKDSNIHMSIEGILLKQIVPELFICYRATEYVNKIAQKHQLNVSFTGYAGGAWLAEYAIYFSHVYFGYNETKAVLFDSPGIPNVNKSDDQGYRVYVDLDRMNIVNYLTEPSFTNSTSRHAFGEAWRIFIESDDDEKKKFLAFLPDSIKSKVFASRFFLHGMYTLFFNHNSLEKIVLLLENPGFYKERVRVWPVVKFNGKKASLNENIKSKIKTFVEKSVEFIPFPEFVKKAPSGILASIIATLVDHLFNSFAPGLHLLVNLLIEYSKDTIEIEHFEADYSSIEQRKDQTKPSLHYCTELSDEQSYRFEQNDANYWSKHRKIHDLKMFTKIDQLNQEVSCSCYLCKKINNK